MKTIYLAGAIADRSDEDCIDWREEAKKLWPGACRNPMDRDYRGAMMTSEVVHDIVTGDLCDIDCSDGLVVMYDRPSVGTSMEIFYAYQRGKPVVIINKSGRELSPWLLYHSNHVCEDMNSAILQLAYLT